MRGSRKNSPEVSASTPKVTSTVSPASLGLRRRGRAPRDLSGSLGDRLGGAADLRAGQSGDREKHEQSEKQEEIELDRKQRGGQQFEQRDDGRVEVIAIGLRRENSDDGEKEQQMNGRR